MIAGRRSISSSSDGAADEAAGGSCLQALQPFRDARGAGDDGIRRGLRAGNRRGHANSHGYVSVSTLGYILGRENCLPFSWVCASCCGGAWSLIPVPRC